MDKNVFKVNTVKTPDSIDDIAAKPLNEQESLILKKPFSMLVLACLFCLGIMATGDTLAEETNFVPFMMLFLFAIGIFLFGFFNIYLKKALTKNIIIVAVSTVALCAVALLMCLTAQNSGMMVGAVGVISCVAVAIGLYATGKLDTQKAIILLFCVGFILRLAYILYTDVGVWGISGQDRQHDVFYFGKYARLEGSDYRHAHYIEWFFKNFSLPSVEPQGLRQIYHPPLHHFIAGMWMRIGNSLGMSYNGICEGIQVLTLFYSSACMIIVYKILDFIKLRKMALLLPLATVCIHPTLIIMSGSVNNDILSVALAFGAVYTAMRWYDVQNFKYIILTALLVGGSMTAKLSGGLIAPGIAIVFLVALIKSMKKHGFVTGFMRLLPQFAVFAVICVPLGLWWQVRTALLFDVPLTYVPAMGKNSDQFIGDYSLTQRLFELRQGSLDNVYVNWTGNERPFNEYNMILALIKTALFGEFSYFVGDTSKYSELLLGVVNVASKLLFISAVALTAIAVCAAVYCIVKKQFAHSPTVTWMFIVVAGVILGNYINFCIQYPFTCTQNFRYCVPVLLVGAVFLGLFYQSCCNSVGMVTKIAKYTTICSVGVFSVSSALFYILVGAM